VVMPGGHHVTRRNHRFTVGFTSHTQRHSGHAQNVRPSGEGS
jgi:hypothetical protein